VASYLITGRTSGGSPVVSIHLDSINQEDPIVNEIDVVNAVRTFLLTVPNVTQTVAQKQEWVSSYV
jgi:hypothetical protein